MDCCAYCTAASYRIKSLYESLRSRYKAVLYRDVLHVEATLINRQCHIFYFSYGTAICWNMSKEEGRIFLEEVKPFEVQPLDDIELEEFSYTYGDTAKVKENEMVLPNQDPLTKLALSYGLSQSVRLATFEIALQKTFKETKEIPEDLARYGSISLSKSEIRKKMGKLFIERSSISLYVDALDSPDFFWEYPELEPLYKLVAGDEELEKRVEVLNRRLGIVHELLEMLGNELNHQHSSRLEWIIIWLILIEIVLALSRDIFHII